VRTLTVTNDDNTSVSLPNGFTVERGGASDVWIDIVGRDRIRVEQAQTFYVTYGNRGTQDAYDIPVFVTIPNGVDFSIGGPLVAGFPPPSDVRATVGIKTASGTLIPIWIYSLPAGLSIFQRAETRSFRRK
jgi:hypothetical protein